MELNLNTLRALEADKTYYIANSTGQIKEAGAWQKIKTFFRLGDGREKVQRLLDEMKVALLKASAESDNAVLSAESRSTTTGTTGSSPSRAARSPRSRTASRRPTRTRSPRPRPGRSPRSRSTRSCGRRSTGRL